ncbi:hypothetical protein [Devosia ginsengisoli]|uniref:Solute-binding protein family 5 domain-containing protein n=1 Tax=Devosia ginsengisoli TaxID=400770 RepID=A0A5B8LW69_9HYPH|nr:hypothetical protein [Devosia ginsengisoli]QDZ11884.1 hypothetical protein FPZ08_14700 [Devosia ginsengisoli]
MGRSFVTALLLASCSAFVVSPASAETLRMAYGTAPVSADPYPYSDTQTGSLAEHVFEMLVGLDDAPLLATEWAWDSPTSIVFNLREGVSFFQWRALRGARRGLQHVPHDVSRRWPRQCRDLGAWARHQCRCGG